MAIAFRADSFQSSSATTCNPGEPTGTAQNDVLVGVCFSTASATNPTPAAPVLPSGWTSLDTGVVSGVGVPSNKLYWRVGYIVRGASAADTTFTGCGVDYHEGYISGWTGVDTTTPIDAQSASGSTGDSAAVPNPDPPSVTAVSAAAMAVAVAGTWQGSTSAWGPSSGYTMRCTNTGGLIGLVESLLLSASGAENPGVVSGGSAGGVSHNYWNGLTVTLAPAGGGGGTVVPVFMTQLQQQGIA